ncbi:RNA-binding domain-containing protein, partial [Rhodoferax sp.]|uniref:RNA-binding domain-containing protein n=1 Tax=Rhodoferax sp. TaxID=50421 RepID=UPI00275380CD|nr:putative DNA binding domain-containing protein [Rhodoferax sp.]
MDKSTLKALLTHLIARWEGEVVEFKRAGDGYSTSDIGKYFSALANEANLRNEEKAWLVFGVDNDSRQVVGTDYRPEPERLHSLKMQISAETEPSITLRDIHELEIAQGRVLLLEIPAAPQGIPIAWKGHYYARAGESLTHLGLDKLDALRRQADAVDWSAQLVDRATVADLDVAALAKARESFAKKYANRFGTEEVAQWPDGVFLDRARLTQDGKITRTALLLLGKRESAHKLSPHPVQLTWKLEGAERAYQHFASPFLLTTTELYQQIRNVQIRILPDDQLLAIELAKYDRKIVLEALHNCIAHQDYTRNGRVVITEFPDRLTFENEGGFFEGQPADYVAGHKIPRRYRNPFLTQAMAELNMIDTMGYGIHEMYVGQARRYFPLPDYDLSEPQAVKMTLHGAIVDAAYSRTLIQHTELSLPDILALDRVQKNLPIDDAVIKRLRQAQLIEGRRPHVFVSASVASATASKASYIRTRAQDDTFYAKLVLDYLGQFGAAKRQEIDTLLMTKLSD